MLYYRGMVAIFGIILSVLWVAFWLYWLISAMSAKKNAKINHSSTLMRLIIIAVVFFLSFEGRNIVQLLGGLTIASDPIAAAIGLVLCICGLAFAVWARVHLGQNWGMPMWIKEDIQLVTSGPYRFVRHPIYSGILLALFGSALVAGLVWLAPFILFGIYFIYSAKKEEQIMTVALPDQYPEYKNRTKMIVPFLF